MSNSDLSRPHVFQPGTNNRVLLLLHGTGADEHDLLNLGRVLDPNASLLSPRGMHLEAGMNRFFERYPDGTFNEDSIDTAVEELASFVSAATQHYDLVGKELIAAGFSNGANTASALLVRRPEVLDGAVLFGSTKPYQNPVQADLSGKRIWLANGDLDFYAPVSTSENWVALLTRFGATVSWLRHPGGHQISSAHVAQIAKELG
jgi:phospholipase/carboxylesterase